MWTIEMHVMHTIENDVKHFTYMQIWILQWNSPEPAQSIENDYRDWSKSYNDDSAIFDYIVSEFKKPF